MTSSTALNPPLDTNLWSQNHLARVEQALSLWVGDGAPAGLGGAMRYAVLDGGKCILQLRGVRPFLSNKYDLTKHPLYRYTADYDKKYAFDIERFLSHRLKLKPDDAVEVYQADLSGEPVA